MATYLELVRQVVREEMRAAAAKSESDAAAVLSAAEAANLCGYRTTEPLHKYHHAGLTPLRREGNRLFYAAGEVETLRKRLFNLKTTKKK